MFLVSTYADGCPPKSCSWFYQWLSDTADDFRVQKSLLSGLNYAVFGLGHSLYGDHYNAAGKNLFDWLGRLSGTAVHPLGLGDQNVAQSTHGGESWRSGELQ